MRVQQCDQETQGGLGQNLRIPLGSCRGQDLAGGAGHLTPEKKESGQENVRVKSPNGSLSDARTQPIEEPG
ncbi:hypothetical protein NDU88_007353 [Pleurodeles waltl]|uniref:Uncharacterized protein n=1 Tax=Pleurodeles waltl TaxID=8319 RepID=A0AAV7NVQ4_PLEWA|nr:hypothetical protein NDU88_007353 [Pleurodeles waltl]